MRQPRPDDVLDAVAYVTGIDPLKKSRTAAHVAARRLAVAALRELCDLSYVECATALGYRHHSVVLHHARGAVDHRLLSEVISRVSYQLEIETAEDARRLSKARLWL